MAKYNDFLTEDGKAIFSALKDHVSKFGIADADDYALAMLANSFDTYSQNAKYCKEHGTTFILKGKNGDYPMISPQFNTMKQCWVEIQKSMGRFGLTPGDRASIFKGKGGEKEKKKGFDLTGILKNGN